MKNIKLYVSIVLLLITVGCKGKQGETGVQGLRGPGSVEMLSGTVTSDAFSVSDPRIGTAKQITVYMSAGGILIESPYFLPASGFNTYYIVTPGASKIDIYNASLASATGYLIVLIL